MDDAPPPCILADDYKPIPEPGLREFGGSFGPEHEADDIDALVDDELEWRRSSDPYEFNAKCSQCGKEWHGLMKGDCPGVTGIVGIAGNLQPGCGAA